MNAESRSRKRNLLIADTTLRDGAQTIGVHFSIEEKMRIAHQLVKLGVDVIEIGCPVGSPRELESAKMAAKDLPASVTLSAFARAKELDIDKAWEGVGKHPNPMLAMLTSVSDIHINAKFGSSRKEILPIFCEKIHYATKVGFKRIMVYLEDGTRTDYAYIQELVNAFFQAGAKIISIPDTVGFVNCPEKYGEIFSRLLSDIKLPKGGLLSAHTHNDKGLAVANALAAIKSGAGQVEGTINGLGERAGNASIGALLMSLYPPDSGKWSSYDYQVKTNIKLQEYGKTAEMVGQLGGLGINYNEPLAGSAVFTTAAGIHQDGVIKDKNTYFCIDPENFGITTRKLMTFNMQSGVKGITQILKDMGVELEKEVAKKVYESVILLAQQKEPSAEDIKAIALDVIEEKDPIIELLVSRAESGILPCSASVVLRNTKTNEDFRGTGYGDGPFAAFMDIVCKLLNLQANILDYHDAVLGEGKEAQMQTFIQCEIDGEVYQGRGISTDIVQAGYHALIKCINKSLRDKI